MFKKLLSFFKKDKNQEPNPNKYTVPGQAKTDIPAAGIGLATGATIGNNPNLNSAPTSDDSFKTASSPSSDISTAPVGPGLEDESDNNQVSEPVHEEPAISAPENNLPSSAPVQPQPDNSTPANDPQESTPPSSEPPSSDPQSGPVITPEDPNKDPNDISGPNFG